MRTRHRVHRTLWGLIGTGLLLTLSPVEATGGSVSLAWDPNPESDLAGYRVHVGGTSHTYTQVIDVGRVTSFTVLDLTDGQSYFFAVTAYDIFANESGYSSEVSATISDAGEPTAPEPDPGSAIVLTATGYKVKGLQKAQLSWNGSTAVNVDIYRDGSKIATTANDGSYTDQIDKKGKGSYTYQVCEEGTTTCSNDTMVTTFNN